MGSKKWHPKGRPNILNKALISCRSFLNQNNIKALISCRSFLNQNNIGHPFWVPFLDPILGVKFWHHFLGPFFNPYFGVQKWCKICKKFLLSKLHSKTFPSKQTCISKCICNHFPANSIFEHNSILHLVKPSTWIHKFSPPSSPTHLAYFSPSQLTTSFRQYLPPAGSSRPPARCNLNLARSLRC